MSNTQIYLESHGEYDYSRWLELSGRNGSDCVLVLGNCCHPGKVSSLGCVAVPDWGINDVMQEGGTLQLTAVNGYLLMRTSGDTVSLEFRGHDDASATKCTVRLRDLKARYESVKRELVL